MSRLFREQDAWPATQFARFLWLAFGIWEDIITLSELHKSTSDEHQRLVVARHLLVDFDSLDELIKEFHQHIKQNELSRLQPDNAEIMKEAFTSYHRAVEPHRESLKEIRNNFGSHRTGVPWENATRKTNFSPEEWGKWEFYLIDLEKRCDLADWVQTLNAAHQLLETLSDFNLGAWYNIPKEGGIRFSMPVLSPGYYPPRTSSE